MNEGITIEELEEAAKPLVELLREKGHPLLTVLVTSRSVNLVEAVKGAPLSTMIEVRYEEKRETYP